MYYIHAGEQTVRAGTVRGVERWESRRDEARNSRHSRLGLAGAVHNIWKFHCVAHTGKEMRERYPSSAFRPRFPAKLNER